MAAFLAPFVLSIFFSIYNIFIIIIRNYPISISIKGFFSVYIIALTGYLLIGMPCSLIIEHVKKGFRWLAYLSTGFLIGMTLNIIRRQIEGAHFSDWSIIWWYSIAAFAYYASLNILKWIDTKLRNNGSI